MKNKILFLIAVLAAVPCLAQHRRDSTSGAFVNTNSLSATDWFVVNRAGEFSQFQASTMLSSLLSISPTVAQPYNANLVSWAAIAPGAKQDNDSDLTAIAALTTTSFGRGLLDDADAAAVRTTIGAGTSSFSGAFASLTGVPAPIGSASTNNAATLTNVQPSNIAWSGISTAAFTNGVAARIPVYTNGGTIYYLTLSTNTP